MLLIPLSLIPVVTSRIYEFRGLPFILFQVDTIPIFRDSFFRSFFACDHTSSTVCILCSLKQIFNFNLFSNKIISIFSNLEHLADLLKKFISIDISFDSKFLFQLCARDLVKKSHLFFPLSYVELYLHIIILYFKRSTSCYHCREW